MSSVPDPLWFRFCSNFKVERQVCSWKRGPRVHGEAQGSLVQVCEQSVCGDLPVREDGVFTLQNVPLSSPDTFFYCLSSLEGRPLAASDLAVGTTPSRELARGRPGVTGALPVQECA